MICELFGILCTIISVIGVILNNRKMIACFYLWILSNSISMGLHVSCHFWSLATRDALFTLLAIEGILQWRETKK